MVITLPTIASQELFLSIRADCVKFSFNFRNYLKVQERCSIIALTIVETIEILKRSHETMYLHCTKSMQN